MRLSQQQFAALQARMIASKNKTHPFRREQVDRSKAGQQDWAADERDLHADVLEECRRRGWLAFNGRMDRRSHRTVGEPDFTILADGGRVIFCELKSKRGKKSEQQRGIEVMAAVLGHKIHEVRSLREFVEIANNPLAPQA